MFMVSLNTTVIAPAMSIIATDMDALAEQTWIATAYLLAFNSSQPLSGKFSDIFGRKPVLLFGIFTFFIGSIVNAVSPNIDALIAGRTVQGLGGGCIMSMAFIIIADMAPLHLRPRFQSLLIVVYGLASVVGPLVGGAFVDKVTWRWDFWLNVILGGVALILVFFLLKETTKVENTSLRKKLQRIDWLGTIVVIGFICCLLLALNWGQSYGWKDAHALGPFIAAGVALILLIIIEGWIAPEPLLPRQVILDPGVFVIYLYIACLGVAFIGTLYYGPILFQSVFGADSTNSGVRLIPYMVMLIIASVSSGYVMNRFPYIKFYIVLAAVLNIIGYGLFFTVNENSTWAQQACYLMFCGFAFGLSQQNTMVGVQSAAAPEFMAVATALNNFFLMLGASVGVAVYETLFSEFLQAQLKGVDAETLALAQQYGATSNYLYIRNMPTESQPPILHAYMEALHDVFILPLGAAGICVICACFMKNTRFGQSNAKAEKEAEEISKVESYQHDGTSEKYENANSA
ncbi:major facilitator superfamily-domain-containing protein [Syncephalastrum racemosum]|uniref:MFS-type drug efflux transporter P55 n=1 Tax=Syncephalastrum racemosum TaxID=13706 RepID=A0A1X2HDH1_SYNRA|nr:major facilitator superfamily-domain-containing protein [Syncephalastrum racemosum]